MKTSKKVCARKLKKVIQLLQKELPKRTMPKDVKEVKIDVKKQINVTEADTQLCKNININDENFSIRKIL